MLERFDPTVESANPCYKAFADYQTGLYKRARTAIQGLGRSEIKILDAASGIGYGSTYLADMGTYEGLDADSATVERARQRWPGIKYTVANLDEPQTFEGRDKMDAIISFETAEHLKSPERFLKNCRASLRPDGMFCFSVPTAWTKDFDPYHRNDWPAEQWEALLRETGFEIVSKHPHVIDETFSSFRTMIPVSMWRYVWAGWRAMRFGYLPSRIKEWLVEGRFRCQWTMWVCTNGVA